MPAKAARQKTAAPARKAPSKKVPAKGAPARKAAAGSAGKRQGAMSDDHKAALARGRAEGRAVRAYLDALADGRPRGRQRTPESIDRQLEVVLTKLRTAKSIDRLNLLKQRDDLQAARERLVPVSDMGELEANFARVAKSYGERRGIGYSLWRETGVPASVLSRAGIARTRSTGNRAGR